MKTKATKRFFGSLPTVCLCLCFAICSCGDSDSAGMEPEKPDVPVKPEPTEEMPLDGVWIELDATDVEQGTERRLIFSSNKTYSEEIYTTDGMQVKVETNGSFMVDKTYVTFSDGESCAYKVSGDVLTLTTAGGTKKYKKHVYSAGVAKATSMSLTTTGMITEKELKAFKGFMMYSSKHQVPTTSLYDNDYVFRDLGKGIDACTQMFEVTYDLLFLNRAIEQLDAAYYFRNMQPGGAGYVCYESQNQADVWLLKSDDSYIAAVEQGEILSRFAYVARLILETPALWNIRVAANDKYNYGPTYKERAMTYLNMCDKMYEDWLSRFQHPGDDIFYRRSQKGFIEPIAFNQSFMACNGLDMMAQCHALLGNTAKVQKYDKIVEANLKFWLSKAWTTQSPLGTTCLQWKYNAPFSGASYVEDLNHASLDANELYNIYLGGHHPELLNPVMTQVANAVFDIVFAHGTDERGRYPGRINGEYDGQYCDGYVRDNFIELTDIRKDWYEKVVEIDKKRYPGSLSMMGKLLWCKARRTDAVGNITTSTGANNTVSLRWTASTGNVTVMRSYDLWTWTTIGTADASAGKYTDDKAGTARIKYYRLIRENGNKAGYSPLIVVQ